MRSRRGHSLVWLRPDGQYRCNFQINGRRFRDSLGTASRAEAEARAAELYAQALRGPIATGGAEKVTIAQALGRFWTTRGQHQASAPDIARWSKTLIAELGGERPFQTIAFRELEDYIVRRRVRQVRRGGKTVLLERAAATINRELELLRRVILAAAESGIQCPKAISWKRLLLPEPERRQHILSVDEEEAFFAALRPDYWPLIEFALLSGLRLENLLSLRWDQIHWHERVLTVQVKSKRPGGKQHVLPLTERMLQLLAVQRGGHAVYVFTYICRRNRHDRHSGTMQEKGARYPFSYKGWVKDFGRARREAGVPLLRFHDLRHTAATRTLRACGNLVTVQRMLGHADVATTARYATADQRDVAAALEAAQRSVPLSVPVSVRNEKS